MYWSFLFVEIFAFLLHLCTNKHVQRKRTKMDGDLCENVKFMMAFQRVTLEGKAGVQNILLFNKQTFNYKSRNH